MKTKNPIPIAQPSCTVMLVGYLILLTFYCLTHSPVHSGEEDRFIRDLEWFDTANRDQFYANMY